MPLWGNFAKTSLSISTELCYKIWRHLWLLRLFDSDLHIFGSVVKTLLFCSFHPRLKIEKNEITAFQGVTFLTKIVTFKTLFDTQLSAKNLTLCRHHDTLTTECRFKCRQMGCYCLFDLYVRILDRPKIVDSVCHNSTFVDCLKIKLNLKIVKNIYYSGMVEWRNPK